MSLKINGIGYDQTSVRFNISALGPLGQILKELTWSHSTTAGDIRDGQSIARGSTLGRYSVKCSLTFQKEDWDDTRPRLITALQGQGITIQALTLLVFDMQVLYIPVITSVKPSQLDLLRCRIVEEGEDKITGDDGIIAQVPVRVEEAKLNGIGLVPSRV